MSTKIMTGNLLLQRNSTINNYVGVDGEVVVDYRTEAPVIRLHDGVEPNGYPVLAKGYYSGATATPNVSTNATVTGTYVITASGYASIDSDGNGVNHVASYWEIVEVNTSSPVYTSGRNTVLLTELTSTDVGAVLEDGVNYKVRVQFEGVDATLTDWSEWVTFSKVKQLPDTIVGVPFSPLNATAQINAGFFPNRANVSISEHRLYATSLLVADDASVMLVGFPYTSYDKDTRVGTYAGSVSVGVKQPDDSYTHTQTLILDPDELPTPASLGTSNYNTNGDHILLNDSRLGFTAASTPDCSVVGYGCMDNRIAGGAVFIYDRTGNSFAFSQMLSITGDTPPEVRYGTATTKGYGFGSSLQFSADGSELLVGEHKSPEETTGTTNIGAIWHFKRVNGTYVYHARYNAPTLDYARVVASTRLFGYTLSLSRDGLTFIAGEPNVGVQNTGVTDHFTGRLHVYKRATVNDDFAIHQTLNGYDVWNDMLNSPKDAVYLTASKIGETIAGTPYSNTEDSIVMPISDDGTTFMFPISRLGTAIYKLNGGTYELFDVISLLESSDTPVEGYYRGFTTTAVSEDFSKVYTGAIYGSELAMSETYGINQIGVGSFELNGTDYVPSGMLLTRGSLNEQLPDNLSYVTADSIGQHGIFYNRNNGNVSFVGYDDWNYDGGPTTLKTVVYTLGVPSI